MSGHLPRIISRLSTDWLFDSLVEESERAGAYTNVTKKPREHMAYVNHIARELRHRHLKGKLKA